MNLPREAREFRGSRPPVVTAPEKLEEAAFWPVTHLSEVVRTGQVTSEAFRDEESCYHSFDVQALDALRGLGVDPIPLSLPSQYPMSSLRIILNAEAAAAFDDSLEAGETI